LARKDFNYKGLHLLSIGFTDQFEFTFFGETDCFIRHDHKLIIVPDKLKQNNYKFSQIIGDSYYEKIILNAIDLVININFTILY